MSDLRTALEMKIAKWRKPNTGHLTESERDIAEGFERAADELEALLASESAPPAPVLPHWCDKIWDRLRCRTCRAEAWNIEEMQHKSDCPHTTSRPATAPAPAECGCIPAQISPTCSRGHVKGAFILKPQVRPLFAVELDDDTCTATAPTPADSIPTLTFDGLSYDCALCGNRQIALCEHWQALFERAYAAIAAARTAVAGEGQAFLSGLGNEIVNEFHAREVASGPSQPETVMAGQSDIALAHSAFAPYPDRPIAPSPASLSAEQLNEAMIGYDADDITRVTLLLRLNALLAAAKPSAELAKVDEK